MTKRYGKRLFQLGLGLALLVALAFFVDIKKSASLVLNADLRYLAVAFVVTVLSRILMAFKWNLLLRANRVSQPHLEVLRVYYVSNFLGFFLPATVGMDILRALLVKTRKDSYSDIVSSIIVERLLGMAMIALLAVLGSLALIRVSLTTDFPAFQLIAMAGALILVAVLVVLISFSKGFKGLINRLAERLGRVGSLRRPVRNLKAVFDSYYGYRHHRLVLLVFCLLTALEIMTLVAWNYCAARSLGVDIGFVNYVYFVPILTLLVRLPITFDGFGLQEGAFVFFLALFGVAKEQGLAVGLAAHTVSIVGLLPGGLLYAFTSRYRKMSASRNGLQEGS